MRIGFDADPIFTSRGGIGGHAAHLLRALLELKEDLEFVCYVRPGLLKNGLPPGWQARPDVTWVSTPRTLLRWRGRLDGLDLFHGTNFKMRAQGRHGGVLTIYDVYLHRYPQYSRKLLGQRLSFYRTRRTARRARRVITISQHAASEIQEVYGLPPGRIAVIPCGVAEQFRPVPDREAFEAFRRRVAMTTSGYVLFIGGADPRKNHEVLLTAVARRPALLADRTVLLVGDPRHRFGDIPATIRRLGLDRQAICVGRVTVEELRMLYSHAEVFVFPSLYEGFGMPVLEAMACGAPVVTARSSALPEVAGDAAVLFDPRDPDSLAEALTLVLGDVDLRRRLREKGFERAKAFPWSRAARETFALYREIVDG